MGKKKAQVNKNGTVTKLECGRLTCPLQKDHEAECSKLGVWVFCLRHLEMPKVED